MSKNFGIYTTVFIGVILILIWSLMPLYWGLVSSLTPAVDMANSEFHLIPARITFENYEKLLSSTSVSQGNIVNSVWPMFKKASINSLITSLAATVITVLLAAFGSYAFVRLRFPFRNVLFGLIVATMAIPAYTVMIPLYRFLAGLGLIDTYVGVILVYVSSFLPLALWLMRSVYESMPLSLEEAAWMDGASRMYTLVRIVLPLAAPGLIATAILTFLNAWGQFMIPLTFSPTLNTKPLTVLITEFVSRNYMDYGLMNAAGMLAIIPPLLVVVFLNRYLVSGLMAGSVK